MSFINGIVNLFDTLNISIIQSNTVTTKEDVKSFPAAI